MKNCKLVLLLVSILLNTAAAGQTGQAGTARTDSSSSTKRGVTFAGLLQPRYSYSLTNHVDFTGQHFSAGTNGNTNAFTLRRARFQAKAQIDNHFDAVLLVNFAEFNNTTISGRVLENAFLRYTHNRFFHFLIGQHRPFFGVEDAIPVDLIPSLDYSNQYYLFGSCGWQSFQIGAAVYGDLYKNGRMPLRYYVGTQNGNGRNQANDNENSKHVYARLEADVNKKTTLGANGGVGGIQNKGGTAAGIDVKSTFQLGPQTALSFISEIKEGTNFTTYVSTPDTLKHKLNDYRMWGIYVFPNIRFNRKDGILKAVEFSARYEYIDQDYKLNSNPRHTIIPMAGFVFAENYYAVLQVGVVMDLFKHNIPLTTQYTRNIAVIQFQVRF